MSIPSITPEGDLSLTYQDIVTLINERTAYEKAYGLQSDALHACYDALVLRAGHRGDIALARLCDRILEAITESEMALPGSVHATDMIDRIYCDKCHAFLTPESETAGYCIRCSGK
jgi:hypothetical protein